MRTKLLVPLLVLLPKSALASPTSDADRTLGTFAFDEELGEHFPFSGGPVGSARGSLSISLLGGIGRWVSIEGPVVRWHVGLEVQLPLDRFARGDRPLRPHLPGVGHFLEPGEAPGTPMNKLGLARTTAAAIVPLGFMLATGRASGKDPPKGATTPVSASVPASASVSVSVPVASSSATPEPPQAATIRQLIVAAWRVAGLDREEVASELASRARTSALVPHLTLRVHRGLDTGLHVYGTYDASDRYSTADSTTTFVEARLTFRLDRLVFADEEVSIERLKLERAELKQKVASRVIDLTLRWQRARRAAVDPDRLPVEREEAALVATEALLALDAYTDGAASKLLPR